MKIQEPTTCESCLSLLTGIIIPKPMFPKEENFGFVLETSDAKILKSIAKQVSKGIAMTDRQYALVKRKLITYKEQFEKQNIDLESCIDNLMYPLRDIDRSHWLRILTYKDEDWLAIRFPFSKKIIDRINELQSLQSIPAHQKPPYKDHTHCFAFTPKNVFELVNITKKFEQKFYVHKEIKDIYKELIEYENNKDDYIPGVYDYKIKNIPDIAIKNLESELGKCNKDNIALYFERRHLFGLKHFDMDKVNQNLMHFGSIAQKIIKRNNATMLVSSKNVVLNDLILSIFEVERLPILVVLDNKNAHDQLTVMHNLLKNIIKTEDMTVMFRLEGKDNEFNKFIQKHNLNNQVAKNTKVVYISNNKLPKPLLKSGFVPKTCFSYGGKGLSFNNVTHYIQNHDLQIVYEQDKTSSPYWNRTERKIINGFM